MENNGKVLKVLKYFICLARNATKIYKFANNCEIFNLSIFVI